MNPLRSLLLLLCAAMLAGCGGADEAPIVDDFGEAHVADLTAHADRLFGHFTDGAGPGAAVTVIHRGTVELAQGYGFADLEEGSILASETPIRLGSLSKQFTAMAVMMLAEQGVLTYDDPVEKWVPELSAYSGITLRHLLNHTSGLPDYYERLEAERASLARVDGDDLLTEVDAMSAYTQWGTPLFEPGERYEYSNPGYEALAVVVERASGSRLGAFLEARVFEPLEMNHTSVRGRPETVIADRAIGYRPGTDGSGWELDDDHALNWMVGAGGVYSTLDDLYRWDQALNTQTLVGSATIAEAFSPAVLNSGEVSLYGFGWGLEDRLGRRAVHHTGGWVGFRSAIIRFMDADMTVIVLSNAASTNSDALAEQLAAAHLDDETPAP